MTGMGYNYYEFSVFGYIQFLFLSLLLENHLSKEEIYYMLYLWKSCMSNYPYLILFIQALKKLKYHNQLPINSAKYEVLMYLLNLLYSKFHKHPEIIAENIFVFTENLKWHNPGNKKLDHILDYLY